MSDMCGSACSAGKPAVDPIWRRVLWIALIVNATMFFVEIAGGWKSGSTALLADAVDFFGDAANYGVSLSVLALAPVWRSRTALWKGYVMAGYGGFVLAGAAWHVITATVPQAVTMGAIGLLALAANVMVAILLYAYRNGDANMRSVWLCTRNDAIGNVAVILAAVAVSGTGSGWPDIAVATVMGVLGLTAARSIIVHARQEMAVQHIHSAHA